MALGVIQKAHSSWRGGGGGMGVGLLKSKLKQAGGGGGQAYLHIRSCEKN